ncbi:Myo-inositol-1-phosphate synthase [Coemansia sp. RSA 1722]|nr:Myo-inositol-1-phosphate synthase [Coemansia sp. RSA 486]KAJ2225755.1 Myo-inositol-1-phosphate synthase [Coemansia sp. RSA 485]KAJ2597825.1 Myo-inositol-1-phosphate synthase [Coemansia sp. RSA 1721]KAJ2602346.1 Myo-inositol-1-phosphate synthase [Coemansia sp. RSA 1722]KAJ2703746.1 Myo-inositol-1-phosphate synthase [Coemansia sp. IMI 203386]
MSPINNITVDSAAAAATNGSSSSGVTAFKVDSPYVRYSESSIESDYLYDTTVVSRDASTGQLKAKPTKVHYQFQTKTKVGRVGLMLVGWAGNNGTTVTASILANKKGISWETRKGTQEPNYFGSVMMASTVKLGVDANLNDVYVPFNEVVPMVHPNDIVLGGWDINSMNIGDAMRRAQVLPVDLQRRLYDELKELKPLPSVYYPDFIAANQEERADNTIKGTKQEQLDKLRQDIRDFKQTNELDRVVVMWTANTERYADIIAGVNDTADNLLKAVNEGHAEVSPSTLFALASVLEGAPFVNGSPQNTLVPGVIELAERHRSFVGGDDFKSGQTKIKSVLAEFLVNAGIKPVAITSYNHLGNNDGCNLSAPAQFRSKEISKSSVVDDMVGANNLLYKKGEHPDHTIVIKYVPSVGDSKRALDEYVSEIFMGGLNTISIYNTCEDSLLASPLIIDLFMMTELMTRVSYRVKSDADASEPEWAQFHSVLSILSYMLKAPVVPPNTPVVNALAKQRMAMENIMRAFVGLPPNNEMLLEHKAFH